MWEILEGHYSIVVIQRREILCIGGEDFMVGGRHTQDKNIFEFNVSGVTVGQARQKFSHRVL